MDETEIAAYFIQRLSEGDNPDDLILEICEKTGRKWGEVEALLERVRAAHEDEITRRQSPLLVIMAFVIFLAGVGLAIFSTYVLALQIEEYFVHPAHPLGIIEALQTVATVGYAAISGLIAGIAMMLGSLIGMKKVWAAILKV